MPVIRHGDAKLAEAFPGVERLTLINADVGAGYLDMGELLVAPGKKIPLHLHPNHEEGMYIIEGPLDYVLGDETGVVNTGDAMLAPAGVKHGLTNSSSAPRRVMFIFPTTNVNRVFL